MKRMSEVGCLAGSLHLAILSGRDARGPSEELEWSRERHYEYHERFKQLEGRSVNRQRWEDEGHAREKDDADTECFGYPAELRLV